MSQDNTTTTNDSKNPPVAKIRVGLIAANIWARKTDKGTFHNVTFERRYRDAENNWKSGTSFDASDLLTLAKVADLAHTRVLELQE